MDQLRACARSLPCHERCSESVLKIKLRVRVKVRLHLHVRRRGLGAIFPSQSRWYPPRPGVLCFAPQDDVKASDDGRSPYQASDVQLFVENGGGERGGEHGAERGEHGGVERAPHRDAPRLQVEHRTRPKHAREGVAGELEERVDPPRATVRQQEESDHGGLQGGQEAGPGRQAQRIHVPLADRTLETKLPSLFLYK